jgi:hypothetical protein
MRAADTAGMTICSNMRGTVQVTIGAWYISSRWREIGLEANRRLMC